MREYRKRENYNRILSKKYVKGIENMKFQDILDEVKVGAKFVRYQYHFGTFNVFRFSGLSKVYFTREWIDGLFVRIISSFICLASFSIATFLLFIGYKAGYQNNILGSIVYIIIFFTMAIRGLLDLIINLKGGINVTTKILLGLNETMNEDDRYHGNDY